MTITDLTQAANATSTLPTEDVTSVVSVSVTFDGSAFPTGAYDYELFVFAGHACSAAAAKVEGRTFINNRSESPYGSGWKPTELQTLIEQPDGSVVIEEADGGLSLYPKNPVFLPFEEEFDSGTNGWTVTPGTGNFVFVPTGGNPGGAIRASDGSGEVWFFIAPTAIAESLKGYIDGNLSYQMRQSSTNNQFNYEDIIIIGEAEDGSELVIAYDFGPIPLTTYSSFSVSLTHPGWSIVRRSTDSGGRLVFIRVRPADRDEFVSVMRTASELRIRGEYIIGQDTAHLDNFNLLGRDTDTIGIGFESADSKFDTFVKGPDGTFSRRYKDGTVVEFNPVGLQSAAVDSNGNRTEYTYDSQRRLTTITDPVGLVTTYTYRADGQLDLITDPDGRLTVFQYDVNRRLIAVIYPDGTIDRYNVGNNGQILSAVDQRGQTTSYDYSFAGRLTGATLPDGGTVKNEIGKSLGLASFGVDLGAPSTTSFVAPEDRVTALEDAKGNAAEQEVNEWGAVVRTLDPIGRTTLYERDEDNLVTRIVAPSSSTGNGTLVTDLAYDDQGNVTSKTEASGTALARSMSYEYEPVFNRVTRMVDYAGFETLYEYDDRGNLTKQTNPDGTFMLYTYNAQGLKLSSTDERGNIMSYAYDTVGRLDTMTDPQGVERKMIMDGRGNTVTTFDAFGDGLQQRVDQVFDEMNRLTQLTNAENEISTFAYDSQGNPLATTDPTGIIAQRVYDDKGRIDAVNDPASGLTDTAYDLNDNLTQVTASDGTETVMDYDAVNRVTQTVDALGITRLVAYDARDNVIAVTDGRGNTTTFAYDALDRVIARTNPVGNTWTFEYDARDLRTAVIKPDTTRIEFTYDNRHRLLSAGVAGNATTLRTYSYDDEDNLIAAVAASGSNQEIAHAFTYDNRDQLTDAATAIGPLGGAFSFTYEYDALGRRIAMRDSAGAVTQYLYDAADRLTGITLPSGKSVAMTYDDAGRRTGVQYPNGVTTGADFDTPASTGGNRGLLTTIAHGASGTQLGDRLGSFSYNYDVKGNITAIAESGTVARSRSYALDAIERLTEVADSAGTALETYTLDEEGNRVTSHLSSFYVTDPANRVAEDENFQFEYDVNGNLMRKTDKVSGLTWRYSYTVYDELSQVTRHASPAVGASAELTKTFTFDALGRRHTERTFDAALVQTKGLNWRYDGEHIAHEEQLDVSSIVTLTQWYTHSDGTDDLVSVTLAAGTGTVSPTATTTGPTAPANGSSYYHTDHQGSVRALTDDTGAIINEYSYGAYGDTETAVEAFKQPFRYTSREYDPDTGLMHYRARAYDPVAGRFLQEDPIWFSAGDFNIYRYVWNNPVNWVDPSGLIAGGNYGTVTRATAAGTLAGLTIPGVSTVVRLVGTRAGQVVLREVGRQFVDGVGLGCQVGLGLASIGATVSGATVAGIAEDGCSIVFNENSDDDKLDIPAFLRRDFVNKYEEPNDDDDDCEKQYQADIVLCKLLRPIGRADEAPSCYNSALVRRNQCERGQPLSPLSGWN